MPATKPPEPESLLDVHAGRLYRRSVVARLLDITPSGVYRLVQRGQLTAARNGRILGAELIRFAGAEEARAEAKSRPQYETRAAARKRYDAAMKEAKRLIKEGT